MEPLGIGVATSAFQVEGAVDADGRGASIWDTFCRRPTAVLDGTDGRSGCGSYQRLDDDLRLLTELGVSAYRFSVAWPRVQPAGSGRVEPRGLDYYERLVDGLLARGIRPFPTLYHWDLPQPVEDAGGWPVRDTAERLADYAGHVAARLGDRVPAWATVNEPWCVAMLGYSAGVHAPGRREPEAALAAAHHLLLGHALARDAVRAHVPGAAVGIVLNPAPVHAEPGADPLARQAVHEAHNLLWLQPLAGGGYPERLGRLSSALRDPQVVRAGDLDRIAGSADWVGVNYYTPFRVGPQDRDEDWRQATPQHPYAPPLTYVLREPLTEMGWEVYPAGLGEVLHLVAGLLPGTPLRVTENGAAYADRLRAADGAVDDTDRIGYLRAHLAAAAQARAEGLPVLDYFAWSLLDNFEWAYGYTKLFGLVEVDRQTLRRRPKRSFAWLADRIRSG